MISLVGSLLLGIIGLIVDKEKLLAGVSAGGAGLAFLLFAAIC
jgi:hypothetical protein